MPPSVLAGLQALIRRRVRVVEEDALYRIMVPHPLPLSWGRTVQPYDPAISLLRRVRALPHSHEHMRRPHRLATRSVYCDLNGTSAPPSSQAARRACPDYSFAGA